MKFTIEDTLSRNVDSLYPSKDFVEKLLKGDKKLKIYLGLDPTNPNIHIGNAIPLWKLRAFQALGHQVIFLIGDFTAMIGDPTGKNTTRPVLTKAEIEENAKTYVDQAKKILDFENNAPQVLYNSTWNSRLKFDDVIKLAAEFTVQQMLERDMFQVRLKEGSAISIHELLYPIVQGYDSVAMDIDIELGGTDQTFNMLVGRDLVKRHNNKEKAVITTPLLPGNDGRKMSKSFGNVINITDSPKDIFGKSMAVKDELVEMYLNWTTFLTKEEIKATLAKGPMESKKALGQELIKLYYSESEAIQSQTEFEKTFQKGQLPSEIQTFSLSILKHAENGATVGAFLLQQGLTTSNSDSRRLVQQGGVVIINPKDEKEEKISDMNVKLEQFIGSIVRTKRTWTKIEE